MQKLVLPINRARLTASLYNSAYVAKFGYTHYGVDMVSAVYDRTVYASGNGTVLYAGWDYNAGYTVIIKYPQAYNWRTKKVQNIAFRYFHLQKVSVKAGQTVTKDTVIGLYGGSGGGSMNRWDYHLHIEADTDIKYPNYSPTFGGSTAIIKGKRAGATAATIVNPLDYLHIKSTAPDYQTYITAGNQYINTSDYSIAKY